MSDTEEPVGWDDGDGVDWEDEQEAEEDQQPQQNVVCTVDLIKASAKPALTKAQKRKRVIFSDEDYEEALDLHQISLGDEVEHGLSTALACVDTELSTHLYNIMPQDIRNLAHIDKDRTALLKRLKVVYDWMRSVLQTIPTTLVTKEEGRDGSSAHDLIDTTLKNKAGTCHQINQIFFTALLRLGIAARYVRTIDGVSYQPGDHPGVYKRRWVEANGGEEQGYKERRGSSLSTMLSWVEVFQEETGTRTVQTLQTRRPALSTAAGSSAVVDLTEDGDDSQDVQLVGSSGSSRAGSAGIATATTGRGTGRWIHVDIANCRFDQPSCVEAELRKGKPLQYVLAFEHIGGGAMRIVDRTGDYRHVHRYATGRDKQTRARVDEWMAELIAQTNRSVSDGCPSSSSSRPRGTLGAKATAKESMVDLTGDDDSSDFADALPSPDNRGSSNTADKGHSSSSGNVGTSSGSTSGSSSGIVSHSASLRDDPADNWLASTSARSVVSLTSKHPLPSRLQDFKDHPVYMLERHLLAEQALHPSAHTVAVFKGENVYLQVHKETLRTKLQWRRLLKQVRREEEPVKVVQRRVISHNRGGESEGQGGDNAPGGGETATLLELRLFGSWQTEPIQISPVVNGEIPVNKYGNIEVWEGNKAFVPRGAVFIPNPSAQKTAAHLGLPCVPAVTGFERRGLHTVPIIGGVVILNHHADIVTDASYFVDAVKEETRYAKRDAEITGRWERLLRGVLTRQRVRDTYGI